LGSQHDELDRQLFGALNDEFCCSLLTSVEHFAGGGDARCDDSSNGLVHQRVGRSAHGELRRRHAGYRDTGCCCRDNGQAGMDCPQGMHMQHMRAGCGQLGQVLSVR
jgi:hypothetical protein